MTARPLSSFVICANVLGGCQGTTGPGSPNPATGTHYGPRFPFITVGDMVQVQSALVKSLGIETLLAIAVLVQVARVTW